LALVKLAESDPDMKALDILEKVMKSETKRRETAQEEKPVDKFSYKQLQEEQRVWVAHNFPGRKSHQPLLGIFEEFGELEVALNDANAEEIADALADITIFSSDFASAMGWDFEAVMAEVDAAPCSLLPSKLIRTFGQLSHALLKMEQGIRKSEDHNGNARRMLVELLQHVRMASDYNQFPSLLDLVEVTWSRVRKRDWKKDAVHAGEV
jgi:hypothetical protein